MCKGCLRAAQGLFKGCVRAAARGGFQFCIIFHQSTKHKSEHASTPLQTQNLPVHGDWGPVEAPVKCGLEEPNKHIHGYKNCRGLHRTASGETFDGGGGKEATCVVIPEGAPKQECHDSGEYDANWHPMSINEIFYAHLGPSTAQWRQIIKSRDRRPARRPSTTVQQCQNEVESELESAVASLTTSRTTR